MYVFTRNCRSPIFHVLLIVQNAHRQAILFIDTDIYWISTQTKLSTTTVINLLGLDETSSVAYYSGETETCNPFFWYFSVAIDSGKRKCVGRGGKL